MRLLVISILCLILPACLSISPELEWEDVISDHEPVLNVLGLISADSVVTSFVRVHRSLNMSESEDTLVRDTIGGNIFIYYAPRYVVRDANVIVSNGNDDFVFEIPQFIVEDDDTIFTDTYFYAGDDLDPQPGETWSLSVTTPGGLSLTGETTVPPLPQLNKEQLPDTFYIHQEIDISWLPLSDNYQIINARNLLSYFYDEYEYYYYYYDEGQRPDYKCGIIQSAIIAPEEDSITYRRELCEDGFQDDADSTDWDEDWLIIGLMSMDQNYYDHFIKYGQEDPEFTSLFLGVGGSGRNYGIEGGLGVFGSIAMDRAFMPMKQDR